MLTENVFRMCTCIIYMYKASYCKLLILVHVCQQTHCLTQDWCNGEVLSLLHVTSKHQTRLGNQTLYMSLCVRKPTIWVPTRSDTNQAVQSQKMVRGLKFWTYEVEELYYPCSKNKGADQLRSYCEADRSAPLFSPMQIVDFPMWRLISLCALRASSFRGKLNDVGCQAVNHVRCVYKR